MKTKTLALLMLLALTLFTCIYKSVNSQPLQTGQAIMTFYHQDGYSVAMIDTRLRPPFTGGTWGAAPFSYNPTWESDDIGTVFGIAIDMNKNIFISSTAIYQEPSPEFGPAGPGGIYVLDDATWNSTTFINTLNAAVWNNDPTRIPNTGPSLGNVAFDRYNNQLFCTNFEDGRIYRINIIPSGSTVVGSIAEVFDPIGLTDAAAGYAPLGDRVWGIGVTRDPITNTIRVYYGVWVEHTTSPNPSAPNRIGRVDLNPAGTINTSSNNNSLIAMPNYGSSNYSNPVSDIEFSLDNARMIVAERPMWGDGQTGSHDGRVIEYNIDLMGNWIQQPLSKYSIGEGFAQANGSGGVDYEYMNYNPVTNQMSVCDSVVWMTGHALRFSAGNFVYGLQGNPASGGNVNTSVLIDSDGDLSVWDNAKYALGDVDVLRDYDCFVQPVDTSCMTIVQDSIYCDSTGNGYYYTFQVKNNSATKSITEIEFTIDSPQPPNTVFASPSFIMPSPPIPPQGLSQVYTIHLTGPGTDTCEQFVCYTLSATLDYVDCPTCCFIENCIKLPCCEGCGDVSNDSIYCVNGQYYFSFTVTNHSGFTINKIQLTSPMIGGIGFVPSNITGLNIPDGGSYSQTVQVTGGTAGSTYPVRFKLFWGTTECCYFEKSYTLPPCGAEKCSCGQWQYRGYKIGTDTTFKQLNCMTSILVAGGTNFNLLGNINCVPNDSAVCQDSYTIVATNLTTNTTVTVNQTGVLNFNQVINDNYLFTLRSYCGTTLCDTCQFRVQKSTKIRAQQELMQNYPNPFNPTTQISFFLPSDMKVSVKVYDVTGQLIQTLINNELRSTGTHSVTFDGTKLASGVYFYRLDAGEFSDTKKMLLVK